MIILKLHLFLLRERFKVWDLTDERISDVRPIDAVLQLQLVMWLDVEQQMLVETHAGDEVRSVGALQGTAAVDVLKATGRKKLHEELKTQNEGRKVTKSKVIYRYV